jgi:hypothetical protein
MDFRVYASMKRGLKESKPLHLSHQIFLIFRQLTSLQVIGGTLFIFFWIRSSGVRSDKCIGSLSSEFIIEDMILPEN